MSGRKTETEAAPAGEDLRSQLMAAERNGAPDEQDRTPQHLSRASEESGLLERQEMDHWSPPATLTTPPNDGEYGYRWVAEYVNGAHLPQRMNRATQQGFRPVRIDELPDGFYVDVDAKGDGLARTGGLILMKIPLKFARQRKAHYAKRSQEALNGANQLQGVAGKNAVFENRGTRSLDGPAAGEAMRGMR